MVECGGCDHRFRIEDSVILRAKKFYPGERRDPSLDRFGRIPGRATPAAGFAPAPALQNPPGAGATPELTTASPVRALFGGLAVVLVILTGLLLGLGGSDGGPLAQIPRTKLLVLAAFVGLVAVGLFQLAAARRRGIAALAGGVALLGLLAIPWFTRADEQDLRAPAPTVATAAVEEGSTSDDPLADLKREIGYQPLADARAEDSGDDGKVLGLWMRDLREFNSHQILKYLKRRTGADHRSWFYPRGDGDFLLVLTGVDVELEEVADLCLRFGRLKRVVEELELLEVEVDNDRFEQPPLEVLQDPQHADFYKLNRGELENIDLQRAQRAVRRLSRVEPKVYRKDIVARFQDLLGQGDTELRRDLATALAVWAEPGDGSVDRVLEVANELHALEGDVPESIMAFLVRSGSRESIPLLARLWRKEPDSWQELMREAGPEAESHALEALRDGEPALRFAAVRVLRQVGTDRSLADLEAARSEANRELRVLVDDAIEAIRARGS